MSNRQSKPKKTSCELVEMLRDEKGITFELINEIDAIQYLKKKNNYLRTASYRKNYPKHIKGQNAGKYINLDFAYLTELSTIDFYLREHILEMCIDIEHALKVALIDEIEQNKNEDGYSIVRDFLLKNPQVISAIEQKSDAIFTGELINKYFKLCYVIDDVSGSLRTRIMEIDCPIWVLVEIISFGDLIRLFDFYSYRDRRFSSVALEKSVINPVKSLRNACAHNNCLFTDMRAERHTTPSKQISQAVSLIPNITKEERRKKLSCRPIFEIVCMLYVYQLVVSPKVKANRLRRLKKFVNRRMMKHMDYFDGSAGNSLVASNLRFVKKVVDNSK